MDVKAHLSLRLPVAASSNARSCSAVSFVKNSTSVGPSFVGRSNPFPRGKNLSNSGFLGNVGFHKIGHGTARYDPKFGMSDAFVTRSSDKWWRGWDDEYASDDNLGPYPWEISNEDFQTIPNSTDQEMITFFSTEGLVKIPARCSQSRNERKALTLKFREEDFMDPRQLLCLGALFDISAINGLDSGRRFCVRGFCRSVDMLSAVVEDSVRMQGGQVVVYEKKVVEGNLEEKLHLTVSVPLLFGVPPAIDSLNKAIRHGGGIVDKVFLQWNYY